MLILERPLAIIDLETTGVNINTDRIIELAVTTIFPDMNRETKVYRFNPGIPIPIAATEVHKISYEDIKDEPPFKSRANALHQYLQGKDIGGFNSNSFDFPMLYAEFKRCDITWDYSQHKKIDARVIFVRKEERTLAAAVKFYTGKEIENAHSAGGDTESTSDVLIAQIERYADDENLQSIDKLDLYSSYDKPTADLSGLFAIQPNGAIFYTKGKYKDQNIVVDYNYLNWIVFKSDYGPDTKDLALNYMNNFKTLVK